MQVGKRDGAPEPLRGKPAWRLNALQTAMSLAHRSLVILASLSDSPDAHARPTARPENGSSTADVGGNCLLTRTSGAESYAFGIVWDDKMKTPYWAFMFNVPDFSFASLLPVYSAELVIAGAGWAEAAKADVRRCRRFSVPVYQAPRRGLRAGPFARGSEFSVTTKFGSYPDPARSLGRGPRHLHRMHVRSDQPRREIGQIALRRPWPEGYRQPAHHHPQPIHEKGTYPGQYSKVNRKHRLHHGPRHFSSPEADFGRTPSNRSDMLVQIHPT